MAVPESAFDRNNLDSLAFVDPSRPQVPKRWLSRICLAHSAARLYRFDRAKYEQLSAQGFLFDV